MNDAALDGNLEFHEWFQVGVRIEIRRNDRLEWLITQSQPVTQCASHRHGPLAKSLRSQLGPDPVNKDEPDVGDVAIAAKRRYDPASLSDSGSFARLGTWVSRLIDQCSVAAFVQVHGGGSTLAGVSTKSVTAYHLAIVVVLARLTTRLSASSGVE
jgi:hypothetical protein